MTTEAALKAHAARRRARAAAAGVHVFTMPRLALNVMDAGLRAWAIAWVQYCRGQSVRPEWSAEDEARRRSIELKLAALGIVDPEGFEPVRRRTAKRKFRGVFRGVAGQLSEYRERMRGPWVG